MKKILAAVSCLVILGSQPEQAAAADALAAILDAQPDETRARYQYRHPRETIEFFEIEAGMTVVEGLPGRGWYTKILLPLLGSEGRLIGANYSLDMYPLFSFASEQFMESQRRWTTDFPAGAAEWAGESGAEVAAFHFGAMPGEFAGTADVVFLVRALHNLARFSEQGDFLGAALADSFAALKPGGVLGVVQHHARDDKSDEFASGSRGYLKKSFVIAAAEQAGFEFVAVSDVNANPKDQPGDDDIVWRLPPTLATSADNPELRAELEAVGESNRMTLKFRKPE
jgi:predicted methyltransferase